MRHAGGRACARGEGAQDLLRSQGHATDVWHRQCVHRSDHGAGAVLGTHSSIPLPEGK